MSINDDPHRRCSYVEELVMAAEGNSAQCDEFTRSFIQYSLNDTMTSLNSTCSFPCQAMPCKNGGTCQPTSYDNYTCSCLEGFTGQNCSQGSGDERRHRQIVIFLFV